MLKLLAAAALFALIASVVAQGAGDPMSTPQPNSFLTQNSYCTSSTCRSPDSPLPASMTERQLHAMFNFGRTDPQWFKTNFPQLTVAGINILNGAGPAPPVHYWYTLAVTAHDQATDMVFFSPRPLNGNVSQCETPGNGELTQRCFFDRNDFTNNGLTWPADQDCKPNRQPTDSMFSFCCFRLSDCEDSTQQHADRVVTNGFPWRDCGSFADCCLTPEGFCGGQAGFLAADTGDPMGTLVEWFCDDRNEDDECEPDCTDDTCTGGASGRRSLIDRDFHLGGAGYATCGACEWNNYWTYSMGFFSNRLFQVDYPIASGAWVARGPSNPPGPGYLMSYWSVSGTALPSAAYVVISNAGTWTALELSVVDVGSSLWVSGDRPSGACEQYAFMVPNPSARGGGVARYPENGNLEVGTGCSAAGGYVPINPTACNDGSNNCGTGGICVDSNTCFCFADETTGQPYVATAGRPCASVSPASQLVVAFVLVLAALLLAL